MISTIILRLSLVVAAVAIVDVSDAQARPNFLIIFTDDQGMNDVGCYGSEIPTPHIDSLARDGLRFTSWYAASSICTPSRFGLLTGRVPSRSNDRLIEALMFLGKEDAHRGIRVHETTIAEVLQESGYRTALIGKWHLGHGKKHFLPTRHGFDHFRGHTGGCIDYFTMTYGIRPDWYHGEEHVDENGYATDLISDEAVAFLKTQKDAEEPFFLYLPYNAPHFGKGWSPADDQTVNIMQPQASDLKRVEQIDDKIRREFAAMTVALDDGIGRVLEALEENGLAENTFVLFMTDHGGDPVYGGSNKPLRGDKATLFEGGIRVPCIIRWPGKVPPGETTDEVAWSIDLFPTLCSLAGVDYSDESLDGRDIAPLLLEGAPLGFRTMFWETGRHDRLGRGRWLALRHKDWKYISDTDGTEYVFNLHDDPNESTNLAADQPKMLRRMRRQAERLARKYAAQ